MIAVNPRQPKSCPRHLWNLPHLSLSQAPRMTRTRICNSFEQSNFAAVLTDPEINNCQITPTCARHSSSTSLLIWLATTNILRENFNKMSAYNGMYDRF